MPSRSTLDGTPTPTYQHVVVRGLPYNRGLSHGQQAGTKVRANVEYYRRPGKLASAELTERIIREVYIPALKKYYPSGLEEMRGISDGAGVTLEDIVLLNARYDLARLDEAGEKPTNGAADGANGAKDDAANECTSAFFLKEATASGDVINTQNWDMAARLWLSDCIIYLEVHPEPSENKPSLFLITEAGQLGRSGMNSYGMAVTANSLMSTDDYIPVPVEPGSQVKAKPVLPLSMLRRMILESSHLAEALTAAHNFPRHVSNNLTVATADGFGMCLEVTPDRIYKVYGSIDDHYLIHTNHFTHNGFESRPDIRDRYPGGSSWFRRQRFEQGIRLHALSGQVTTERISEAFSDHLSYPEALCCHPASSPIDAVIDHLPGYPFRGASATVACVMYNTSQRTVTVCKGPPCQGTFQTYELAGERAPKKTTKAPGHESRERPELP
ncbi:Peptidase C45 acyl-coenzyme A [Pleurostoma richardsiae]|uniref:Peptidase C45 acyl-coenzyme A n=1 Tax=Pleurostoma richardsiae TaxID=41990 RepID=A0AA38VNH7_9PEZI|nr:Peptidase C45 acyl-coenzyme A [Pleurostoma richardsiae]